jgi:hypothetical protein
MKDKQYFLKYSQERLASITDNKTNAVFLEYEEQNGNNGNNGNNENKPTLQKIHDIYD